MEVQNLWSAVGIEVLDVSPNGLGSLGIQVVPVVEAKNPLHGRRGGFDKVNLPIMRANGSSVEKGPACAGGGSVKLGNGTVRSSPAILSECLVSLDGSESPNKLGRREDVGRFGGARGDPPLSVISPEAGEGNLAAGILPFS